MAAKPTQSREGVKGGLRPFSFAPCGVQRRRLWWGLVQRPNRCTVKPIMLNALNPAALVAGSAASLRSNFARPQTRPQAALSTYSALSRQMGATDQHREKSFSLGAGLFCCRDFASAEATRGLCGRPLDCFAAHTPIIDFVCCMENRVYGHNSGAQNPPPCKKPPRFARSGYCYPQRFHISCTYSTSMSSNASSPFFASAFASPWRTKHIVTKLRAEKIAA